MQDSVEDGREKARSRMRPWSTKVLLWRPLAPQKYFKPHSWFSRLGILIILPSTLFIFKFISILYIYFVLFCFVLFIYIFFYVNCFNSLF